MKLNKTIVGTATINEDATRKMEALHSGKETVTFKHVLAITGPKAERDETIAIANVLGMSLSERNDKTFVFSQEYIKEHIDEFQKAVKNANRNCASVLRKLRGHLTDDEKENGRNIAVYNEAYNILKDRLSDTALEGSVIRDKMRSYGYSSHATLKFEHTVKLGGKKKTKVSDTGWKAKNIDGNNWYVKTADTIGAKAVPVTNDESRGEAINVMNEWETKYVNAMKKWLGDKDRTEEQLFDIFKSLYSNDIAQEDVEIFELSDADLMKAGAIANEVEGRIRNGN